MRIVMLGIRGIPAAYGGLENCAEEVGVRLAARGHEVLVYCRQGAGDDAAPWYQGVRRIVLPSLKTKWTDTYSHSLLSIFHALWQRPDVILAFNPGIATLCMIPKLLGYKVVLHADGFDWRRKKWGWLARTLIHRSASLAAKLCDRLIFDCVSARDYCAQRFWCARPPLYIPNGATPLPAGTNSRSSPGAETLRRYGLERDGYFLFLSRIEPENMCELMVRAFAGLKTDKKLVIAGGGISGSRWLDALKRTADPRVIFPGPIYDPLEVRELHQGCYALLHGNQAGGTSVGLLKALGMGVCVLSLNTPDNAYVVRDAGILYNPTVEDLQTKLQFTLDFPERVVAYRRAALQRIGVEYDWDVITDAFEHLFQGLAGLSPAPPRPHLRGHSSMARVLLTAGREKPGRPK
jgi:glycosyltransferase involved in cell wall biosynthesis